MQKSLENRSILLLPIGAILVSVFSFFHPAVLSVYGNALVPLLGVVMFSMGMTLTPDDFKRLLSQPVPILIGVVLQYVLMPLIAWLLSIALGLPLLLATGLILLGACPGGTASNVICYLAGGNVAMSISLTAISTMLATVLTPLITLLYVDQSIVVPVEDMMKKLLYIIVLPVLSGVLINLFFQEKLARIKSFLPLVSVISIVFIIGVIVAKTQAQLVDLGVILLVAVTLHNLLGLTSGYFIPKWMGFDKTVSKTIAIEVGMQNSGLAVVLANQFFSPVSALPGAVFSIWHNISGALIAVLGQNKNKNE